MGKVKNYMMDIEEKVLDIVVRTVYNVNIIERK